MKNIRRLTKTSLNKENAELAQQGNILKGYVNYLRRKTLLGLQNEEKKNNMDIKLNKKVYESSKNLKINSKIKQNKYIRKLSYNVPNNRLFNVPIQTKLRKNNSLRPEIALEFNSPKKNENIKQISPKSIKIPKKSQSNNIKLVNTLNLQPIKNKQFLENTELFSLFKTPQYFEGENSDNNSIILDNNDNSFSGLSSKNILQLNEIKKELRDTFLGKKINLNERLNKKSFMNDDIDDLDYPNYYMDYNFNDYDKEKYRILTRKGYVYDSFDEEESLDEMEIYSSLSPDSFIVKFIDFLVFVSAFYNLIYIPIFLAFDNIYCHYGNYFVYGNIIENLIDIIFIIDIVLTFFVSYYNFEEVLILDYKSIAKNYIHTWFFIDLISAIPIKTLLTIFNKKCYNKAFLSNPLYNHNFIYLLTLIRLIKTFQVISINKFYQILEIKLSKFNIFHKYFRLFISLIIFFISLHLVSCIFIFLGKNDYPNWIINFNHQNKNSFELYIISVYYTIETVTTVGYGDLFCTNLIERIFGLFMEIFGIVAYSWALTAMINYVRRFTDKAEGLYSKFRILDDIKISYPQLNEDLYDRIHRFLKYKHESEQKDSHIIFEDLPITLRNTLIYEMYKPMIGGFIFFKNFSNSDFIVKIILALKPILALRNDILIKDGDFVEDIIFVKKGKLSLELPLDFSTPKKMPSSKRPSIFLNRDNNFTLNQFKTNSFNFKAKKLNYCKTVTRVQTIENKENIQHYRILQIRKNEHFGDILMFLNQRSPLCLKVKSKKVELFFLNKSDAINISTIYPQYWKKINKKSLFNMEQIKRLINKITRLIKNMYGHPAHIKRHIRRVPSVLAGSYIDIIGENDYELKSIPSINEDSEIYNSLIYDNIKKDYLNNNKEKNLQKIDINKYQKDLKTIFENENNSSSSFYSSSLSSTSSMYNSKNQINIKEDIKKEENLEIKNNNTLDKNKNDIDKDKTITIKKNLTPYTEDEINDEIYPEETFIITGGAYKEKKNKNNVIQDNISICSTESFSISSEYENINELCEFQYSKNKKIKKKIKNFIKEQILKNKTLTKSTISDNSENSKDSILKKITNNKGNNNKKKHNYNKIPSSVNSIPKNLESFGFEKNNTSKENFIRNNSNNIINLKVNKMLSYQVKDNSTSNVKEKEILDFIGHNIEKNVMILNNPEQFYSEFFINVMNKKNNHSISKKEENLNHNHEAVKRTSLFDNELNYNS